MELVGDESEHLLLRVVDDIVACRQCDISVVIIDQSIITSARTGRIDRQAAVS